MAVALAVGAGLLVLPQPSIADPPPWAKAKGHRKKHAENRKAKHVTRHRYEYREVHADEDEIGDWDDREVSGYPRPTYRDTWSSQSGALRPSVFRNGLCIPRPSATDAGAVLGQGLASQVTGGNAASSVLGGILGAAVGSQIGGTRVADEDCTYQVLEGAADRERIAWDADSATRYRLTPVRSFSRDGLACREIVSERVQGGEIRKSHRTACRDGAGEWHLVD